MRKSYLLGLFIILILGAFAVCIHKKIPENIFCFLDIGTHHPSRDFIEVNGSRTAGQAFVPNFANLFKISIFVDKEGADPCGELIFHLRYKTGKDDLAVKRLSISEIKPQAHDFYQIPPDLGAKNRFHYHIQFPVINDVKDKELYFYLESPTVESGKGIKVGVWKTRYYEALRGGGMIVNGKETDGFVAFRSFNTWLGTPADLLRDIKTRFFSDKVFALSYLFVIMALVSGILLF